MSFNMLTVENELIRRLNSCSVGYNNFFIYKSFISPFLIWKKLKIDYVIFIFARIKIICFH